MSKRLDNSTKAKILFVLLSVVLILITWYKLKVQGITMTEEPEEPTYQALLICNNTDENHVHTDECYEQVEVEANEVQEQEIPENIVEPVQEEENTIVTTENIIEEEEISEENSVNEIIPEEDTIEEFTKELKYEDDELVVIATAEDGKTIPNKASINVCKINKDDEKYAKVEQSLKEKGEEENTTIEGFIAYDITLRDEAFNEIEPNGKVNISLNYKNALIPEGIENQDLEINVHHFEEDSQGNVVEIVNLSENNQLQKVETDDQQKLEKVEFETESFSTFTISYSNNKVKVKVHYVDESGNELAANQGDLTGNATMTLADYKDKITASGYMYVDAHYSSYNGKIITKIQGYNGKTSTSINPNNVTYTVKFLNGNIDVGMIEYESLERSVDIYLVYANSNGLSISDTIANNGCINAITDGIIVPVSSTIKYKWYRSTDGNSWNQVKRIKISGDSYNIEEDNGPSINVALDEGANKYYKVEKYIIDGEGNETYVASATYHVPYFNDVRNGGFENPVVPTGATAQLPNGADGVIWKTTGTKGGQDIEIVNVNNDVRAALRSYNFAYVPEGNQCAELNCEAEGALYQDILTVPGSQLYWSLYHRARGHYNDRYAYISQEQPFKDTMYVVAMSTEDAEKYDVTTQGKVNEILKKVQNQEEGFEDIEIVKIETTNNGQGKMTFTNNSSLYVDGQSFGTGGSFSVSNGWWGSTTTYTYCSSAWHYYSGHFSIPQNQYLTRFFFVANDTHSGNNTVGNLLDDIHVSSELPAANSGQATIRIRKTVSNIEELPNNYSVPISIDYGIYNDKDDETTGTITNRIRDYDSYSLIYDENDNFTGNRTQWHDYTLTIPPNGKGKIIAASEVESNNYILAGYKLITNCKVTKTKRNGEKIVLYNSLASSFNSLQNSDIDEGDFIEVEFTNSYELEAADITVNKRDEDNNLLGGATFKLTGNGIETQISDDDNDGKFIFNGLKYSTNSTNPEYVYTLEEIEGPQGYYKYEDQIQFFITKENGIEIQNGSEYVSSSGNEIDVINMPCITLPKAGGIGANINYIVGCLIMLFAIITYKKIKFVNK